MNIKIKKRKVRLICEELALAQGLLIIERDQLNNMKKITVVFLIALTSCRIGINCSEYNSTLKAQEFNIKIDSLWQDGPNRKWVFENAKEKKRFMDGGVYELYRKTNKGDRIVKKKNTLSITLYKNDSKDSVEVFSF
ncbi:hypothetical protein, partial [Emticicia sp. TH156]|uniref:hypothetical protein n=1 Tax=Emticicia sp. TH156 TaxID=2067454 RepID=UPI000CB3BFF4